MRSTRVDSVRLTSTHKEVRLADEVVTVPKARAVAPGAKLLVDREKLLQVCVGGTVIISPAFERIDAVMAGSRPISLRIHEPNSAQDWAEVYRLRSYHYRSRAPFGRQGVLIAKHLGEADPDSACGLIEIGAAPICNQARDRVLDAPFADKSARWTRWGYAARGKYCGRVAEVTRVVVDPDYRGVGLGAALMNAAVDFCENYWELGGSKPLFVEIVADMLRFSSFPALAGFSYVGETAGNAARIAHDLRYLLARLERHEGRAFQTESSVERMQWKYARTLALNLTKSRSDMAWALARLERADRSTLTRHLGLFQDVIRLPKPVYIRGLTPRAEALVRAGAIQPAPLVTTLRESPRPPRQFAFELRRVVVARRSRFSRTRRGREICLTFGLPYREGVTERLEVDGTIGEGAIVLVGGRSGSGKTTLLRLLGGRARPSSGTAILPASSEVVLMAEPNGGTPVIDLFHVPTDEAVQALSAAGLSEPSVYVRPFGSLSDGQKERARIAMMLSTGAHYWLIDQFAETLDPLTAHIVATRVSKLAKQRSATLVVASARARELRSSLIPDVIVELEARRQVKIPGPVGPGAEIADPSLVRTLQG